MGTLGKIGKGAFALALGTAGTLAAVRTADDRYVDGLWRDLEESPVVREPFAEETVSNLPDPAKRYFLHAIKPGTPLASRMHWRWSGQMKPAPNAPWMDLICEQVSVKDRGFVWKAKATRGPLVLSAVDHYLDGWGRMRISLFGLVPFVNATGADLSKSSLGRVLAESVFMPSALLPGPHVSIEGIDESRFRVTMEVNGDRVPYVIAVDEQGRLTADSVLYRWGNLTDDGFYHYIPYGGTIEEEGTFGGYTIPTRLTAGWWYGTEKYSEVLKLELVSVEYD